MAEDARVPRQTHVRRRRRRPIDLRLAAATSPSSAVSDATSRMRSTFASRRISARPAISSPPPTAIIAEDKARLGKTLFTRKGQGGEEALMRAKNPVPPRWRCRLLRPRRDQGRSRLASPRGHARRSPVQRGLSARHQRTATRVRRQGDRDPRTRRQLFRRIAPEGGRDSRTCENHDPYHHIFLLLCYIS